MYIDRILIVARNDDTYILNGTIMDKSFSYGKFVDHIYRRICGFHRNIT